MLSSLSFDSQGLMPREWCRPEWMSQDNPLSHADRPISQMILDLIKLTLRFSIICYHPSLKWSVSSSLSSILKREASGIPWLESGGVTRIPTQDLWVLVSRRSLLPFP